MVIFHIKCGLGIDLFFIFKIYISCFFGFVTKDEGDTEKRVDEKGA